MARTWLSSFGHGVRQNGQSSMPRLRAANMHPLQTLFMQSTPWTSTVSDQVATASELRPRLTELRGCDCKVAVYRNFVGTAEARVMCVKNETKIILIKRGQTLYHIFHSSECHHIFTHPCHVPVCPTKHQAALHYLLERIVTKYLKPLNLCQKMG